MPKQPKYAIIHQHKKWEAGWGNKKKKKKKRWVGEREEVRGWGKNKIKTKSQDMVR